MNINEIKEKTFETGIRGYRQEEVHSYLEEISRYIRDLQDEKSDLLKKMEILARKVEEYRKDESSIQDALLGAQKLGKSVVTEANEKAEKITKEAEEKAKKMISEAKSESDQMLEEARTTAQETVTKARNEAEKVTVEARQNVENIVRGTKYQIDKEHANLIRMQKEVSNFKSQLLELYRDHIDLIKKLPELEPSAETMQNKEVRDLNQQLYEQKKADPVAISDAPGGVVVNTQTITSEAKKSEPEDEAPTVAPTDQLEPHVETFDDPSLYPGLQAIRIQETKEYDKEEIKTVNEQYRAHTAAETSSEVKQKAAADTLKPAASTAPFTSPGKDHYTAKYGKLQFGAKKNMK